MQIEGAECINKLDNAFYFFESKYGRFLDAIYLDGEMTSNELQLYIDNLGPYSIFSPLMEVDFFWRTKGRIVNEVNRNLLIENGYIDYVEAVFKRHYDFILQQLPHAISRYFLDFDIYPELETLSLDPTLINGKDLIEFVEVQYLHLFAEFEYLFKSVYPKYNILLTKSSLEPAEPLQVEDNLNILIDFTDSQVLMLYNEMKGVFFDCDFELFKCIIRGKNCDGKILWIDKAQNKEINKATLIEFVKGLALLSVNSAAINNFIIRNFDVGDKDIDVKKKRRNLNSARNAMRDSGGTRSSAILDEILRKTLALV